jgi:hypothetical protein
MADKDNLTNFLIDLANNPERMERFAADPEGEATRANLSREERVAVIAGDPSKIRARLTANDNGRGIMLRKPSRKRPGTGIMKKKSGAKKKGSKKKRVSKKK